MHPDHQRLAIGKACGWEPCAPKPFLRHAPSHAFMHDGAYYGGFESLPNYVTDLNAMRQALRFLDDDQWLEFMMYLSDAVCIGSDASKWITVRAMLEASAEQYAAAFLHALGLWDDDACQPIDKASIPPA